MQHFQLNRRRIQSITFVEIFALLHDQLGFNSFM